MKTRNKKILFSALLICVAIVAMVAVIFPHVGFIMGGGLAIKAMAMTGYTRACGFQSGGIKTLYLIPVADVTGMTLVAGVYTTITLGSAKKWFKYDFDPDTCELKEEVKVTNNSEVVTHTIDFFINKMSAAGQVAVNEIATASACGMIAVAVDANGVNWVVGYSENFTKDRYLQLVSSAGTTGKKLSDQTGYTITLSSEDNQPMCTTSAAIVIV